MDILQFRRQKDQIRNRNEVDMIRPGSWIEIHPYSQKTIAKLEGLAHLNAIIVHEIQPNNNSNEFNQSKNSGALNHFDTPKMPFFVKIFNPSEILDSKWTQSPYFKGFLWTANCFSSFENLNIVANSVHPVWLDYEVMDIKKANRNFELVKDISFAGFYCTPSTRLPLRKFHKLLQSTPKSLNILRSICRPHEIQDQKFSDWPSLELFSGPKFEANSMTSPKYSIVIPHYENPYFLSNMLRHLAAADKISPNQLEVLVVDDFSKEETFHYICSFAKRFLPKLSLQMFRWERDYFNVDNQRLFRAGASRNWGAEYAKGDRLLFLDSDMLVPPNIVSVLDHCYESAEFIQFVRHHIPASLSTESIRYGEIVNSQSLYIEEAQYWQKLFDCNSWMSMKDYWKYTCSYGLSLSRELFFQAGRFRRNFIRYGFEDTDLGFRVSQLEKTFKICKTPLLHLTAQPDKSQSWFYKISKTEKLKPMARTFYALNHQVDLYPKFQGLFD